MQASELTLENLISEYQSFLKENLDSNDITEIAFRIKKSSMTVYNYIDSEPDKNGNNKAKDFLTMKAIVEIGTEILEKRGITK